MARNFDGTDDTINLGSDASVDDFGAITIAFWINPGTPASNADFVFSKQGATVGWCVNWNTFVTQVTYQRVFSTTNADWRTPMPSNGTPGSTGRCARESSASLFFSFPSRWCSS